MSSNSPADKNEAHSFLAEEEEAEIQWHGKIKESEDEESPASFAATNSRLIFSFGRGHYKDIGFQHIESVEIGTDIETETNGENPDSVIGIGGTSVVIGFGIMAFGGFSFASALAGLLFIALGGFGIYYGVNNYDQLKEDYEIIESEVYHIILRTNATSPISIPMYIITKEDVGPELSRLVQESK